MNDPRTVIGRIRASLAAHTPKRIEREGMSRAAVLIPLYERDGAHHVLLQVRTELVEHHKGQISFPGGVVDEGDVDLEMTALREAEEEIGLAREDVDCLNINRRVNKPHKAIILNGRSLCGG